MGLAFISVIHMFTKEKKNLCLEAEASKLPGRVTVSSCPWRRSGLSNLGQVMVTFILLVVSEGSRLSKLGVGGQK